MPEGQQKSEEKLSVFSQRLRSRLARMGVQSNEVAEKLGVEPGAVSNWLAGRNLAKGKNLRDLAAFLNCRTSWLSGEEEDELILSERPVNETELWRMRATEAERKLNDLRQGLRSLLELSSPNAMPPANVSSMPPSEDGELLDAAEASEFGRIVKSPRSPGAGGPSVQTSPPSRPASPASTDKPVPPKPAPK